MAALSAVPIPPTVMVLDPDVLTRLTVSEYLRECGYKVIEGGAAQDLWAVLQAATPVEVVLSRVRLAGETDGFGVAQRVRLEQRRIEVILVATLSSVAQRAAQLCDRGPADSDCRPRDLLARLNLQQERRRQSEGRALGLIA